MNCAIFIYFFKAKIMVFVLHKKEAKELCNSINKYKDYIMSPKFSDNHHFEVSLSSSLSLSVYESDSDDDNETSDCEEMEFAEGLSSDLNAQSIIESSSDDGSSNTNLCRKNYAYCLHGDMSKSSRNFVFQSFDNNEFPVLVCTDIASRGLNFSSSIDLVVNMSVGMNIEAFVHRSGRTGRAGKV